jgi:hypothetical protein
MHYERVSTEGNDGRSIWLTADIGPTGKELGPREGFWDLCLAFI